jgi:hypothetical protein
LLIVSNKEEAVIIERSHWRQQQQWRQEETPDGNMVDLRQIDDEMDKRMVDMQNNMENHFHAIDLKLEKMERNIRRMAMAPFGRQRTTQTTEQGNASTTSEQLA